MTSVRLLCLPYAGGAASFYWPWKRLAPPSIEVLPVQFPGREDLIDEEPYQDVQEAIDGLGPGLLDEVGNAPVALYGHSVGAVVAYELARWLVRHGAPVAHLFVSGSPAPRLGRRARATDLPDEEFLRRIEQFAGYQHDALAIPELRELILPLLRADVALHEDYLPLPGPDLDVPVTCLRGSDDMLVTAAQSAAWRSATSGPFDLVELPGGHMYLVDEAPAVLAVLAERLGVALLEAG